MRHFPSLIFAILGAACWGQTAAQFEAIYADNGMGWIGVEGASDFCQTSGNDSSFAYALDFKYDELDDIDYLGGMAVKMFCRDEDDMMTGYISSLEGNHGVYQGIRSCPQGEYFDGFRLRVFPYQGLFGDDFAVDNIQLSCSDGSIVDGLVAALSQESEDKKVDDKQSVSRKLVNMRGREVEAIQVEDGLHGEWGTWSYCSPGMYVMGIRTTVEEGHLVEDDAGLTNVVLYCA